VSVRVVTAEAIRSLTSNLSTTIAATMTVLIGMFLLGLFVALGTWVVSWSDHVKKELLVKVYFDPNATNDQIATVQRRLYRDPRVKAGGVHFISADEALEIMRKKTPDLVKNLTSNPLPPSFEITPRRAEDVPTIGPDLRREMRAGKLPGVTKVNDGKETSRRILRVARVIEVVFLAAVLILLSASVLLIANTIRLSIFSRRREIEVMKLVGATNWFVRGPFMLEGLICGVLGAAAAIALLVVGKEVALPSILPRLNAGSDVEAIAFAWNAAILLAMGLLLGVIGSGLTIRRFLKI
jgi:cell division transport system permease protein